MQIGVEVEVFLDAQVLVQPESLRHVADAGLDLLRIGGNVDAENLKRAGIGGHQSGGQTHQRGLARAVRSDQRGERAAPDLEGDIVERPRGFAFIALKRLMDLAADNDMRHRPGRTHWLCSRDVLLVPEDGKSPLVGRYTVAGEPRRSSSDGSLTKTLTS